MRELLGADTAIVRVSFTNDDRHTFTGVVSMNEFENNLAIVRKTKECITINTDNMNFISFEQETETTEKKGKWLKTDAYPHNVYCSECYRVYVTNEKIIEGRGGDYTYCTEAEFCPHCGVKMETEQEAADNGNN